MGEQQKKCSEGQQIGSEVLWKKSSTNSSKSSVNPYICYLWRVKVRLYWLESDNLSNTKCLTGSVSLSHDTNLNITTFLE